MSNWRNKTEIDDAGGGATGQFVEVQVESPLQLQVELESFEERNQILLVLDMEYDTSTRLLIPHIAHF